MLAPAAAPASAIGGRGRCILLGAAVAVGMVAYLGVRPHQPWLLWLVVAATALAVDGVVRSHPRWAGSGILDSVVFAALPALGVLGAGLFIDRTVDGLARPAIALVPAVAIAAIAHAEYLTVDFDLARYGTMRLLLAVTTYLAAFTLFTMVFAGDLSLAPQAVLIGAVSVGLTMDLLRENRLFGLGAILLGVAVGVSMAELRLILYFFPLDSLLGGTLLVIGFYLATGLIHHLLDHDLSWATAGEYVAVAAAATAAVVVTRVAI